MSATQAADAAEQESDLECAGLLTGEANEASANSEDKSARRSGSRSRRGVRASVLPLAVAGALLAVCFVGSAFWDGEKGGLRHGNADRSVGLFGWGDFRGAINNVMDNTEDTASGIANYTGEMRGQLRSQANAWAEYTQSMKAQLQALNPAMQLKMKAFQKEMSGHKEELTATVNDLRAQMPNLSTEAFEERMELMKAQFPDLSYTQLKTKAKQDIMKRWKEQEEAYEVAKNKRSQARASSDAQRAKYTV